MRKQELHPRTAVINKKQKNKSKKARLDALTWLAKAFPQAFDNTIHISPLKTGIMEDIMEHADKAVADGISKSKLREAVVLFTRRLDYLACLKAEEMRIDLLGQVTTQVTKEESERAAVKIKRRIEKSARNARKLMAEKNYGSSTSHTKSNYNRFKVNNDTQSEDFLPVYPARSNNYEPQVQAQTARPATVVVKKTTKTFDPKAVARLKEKLGLSRSAEEKKEIVE